MFFRRLLPSLTLGLFFASAALAQSTTGALSGTVYDPTQAAAPGASVVVENEDTGLERRVITDAAGAFLVLELAPGRYAVTASLSGFADVRERGVAVTIGRDTVLRLTLGGAVRREQVTVADTSPRLDMRRTSLGGVVTSQQIEDLPLNGRNYLQLATLLPGVIVSRGSSREFTVGFASTPIAIVGARPEYTAYLLDGTNIADVADKAPSGLAGSLLGVDTIREFSVETHGYSAEFGRAAGGIVSAVTKSGTNELHGSGFTLHRDSALDARNYFDTATVPAFVRDQFGGSAGGPVRKNRLFLFAAAEGLRDRRAITRIARLPDANAHNGLLPDATGALEPVAVHPAVRPYLDLLFPIPDGVNFGDGSAELRHSHRDPIDERLFVTRIDWNAGRNDSVMVRVTDDRSRATVSQEHPLFLNETGAHTTYATLQHQRIIGATMLNTFRVAVNRTERHDDVVPTVEIPASLYFTEDPHFGAINIIGLTLAGSTASVPVRYDQRVFQLTNTLTRVAGSQAWKAGIDWQRYAFEGVSNSRFGGEFRFRNLREFLTRRRSASAAADRFTGNLPGTDTTRAMRQHYVALFVQNEWRLRPDLTVNAGVRYEITTSPAEAEDRVAGLLRLEDLESGPHGVTPGTPLFDTPAPGLAPRAGLAWTPSSGLVLRGGYGVFHQPMTVSYYRNTMFRVYPYFAGVDIRQPAVFGPAMRAVLAQGTGVDVQRRSEFVAYDARQPFVQQWHAGVERQIAGGLTAELGYLGSRGHNLPFYGDPNAVPSERLADGRKRVVGSDVRYPSWGRIRTRINAARSIAHALVAGVERRLSSGLMLQASYTYSHSNDTWSGGQSGNADFDNGAGSATDWWDPEAEYGPSNFDVRHTLVVNAMYALPWGADRDGAVGALIRGWHVGGVLQLASGLPFTPFIGFDRAGDRQSDADTIQKPDQIAAVTYPRTADEWFDVSAFALPEAGYYGSARRNSLRGPGLKVADLILFKNIAWRTRIVQLRVEAFNAFNWVNLGLPNASALFNPDGTRRAGAARITTTATPARQIQLGVKVIF